MKLFTAINISLLLLIFINSVDVFSQTTQPSKPSLLLANTYPHNNTIDIRQYWISEKLDGVRAYWNGKQLMSRAGHIFHAPTWFTEKLPKTELDGELWISRNRFDEVSGIVRKQTPIDSEWRKVSYWIFELPNNPYNFNRRVYAMKALVENLAVDWLHNVHQFTLNNEEELFNLLDKTVRNGGEGLMLHLGSSLYHGGRSSHLLKLKPVSDAEAIVIDILPGKGKYKGLMGSLLVELPNKKQFKIGSGFSETTRADPPAIGTKISFEFTGLTKNGLPRFARFKRVRITP